MASPADNLNELYERLLPNYCCPVCFETGPVRWEGPKQRPFPTSVNRGIILRLCGDHEFCVECINSSSGCWKKLLLLCWRCNRRFPFVAFEIPKPWEIASH